jgi:hypothetical protein
MVTMREQREEAQLRHDQERVETEGEVAFSGVASGRRGDNFKFYLTVKARM